MNELFLVLGLLGAAAICGFLAVRLSHGSFRKFWQEEVIPFLNLIGGGRRIAIFVAWFAAVLCIALAVIIGITIFALS